MKNIFEPGLRASVKAAVPDCATTAVFRGATTAMPTSAETAV